MSFQTILQTCAVLVLHVCCAGVNLVLLYNSSICTAELMFPSSRLNFNCRESASDVNGNTLYKTQTKR